MRFLFLTVLCSVVTFSALAQQPLSVGEKQVNIGTGFSGFGVPVFVGLDYGVAPNLTVGGEVSYRSYGYYWGINRYRQNVFGLGANLNYHFNELFHLPPQFNIYGGATVGYFIFSNNGYGGGGTSGIGLGLQVGFRYFFNDKFGLLLEANGGMTTTAGKIGVTIKI